MQFNIKVLFIYRALEVWGSRETLLKELLKKEVERKIYQQSKYIYIFYT